MAGEQAEALDAFQIGAPDHRVSIRRAGCDLPVAREGSDGSELDGAAQAGERPAADPVSPEERDVAVNAVLERVHAAAHRLAIRRDGEGMVWIPGRQRQDLEVAPVEAEGARAVGESDHHRSICRDSLRGSVVRIGEERRRHTVPPAKRPVAARADDDAAVRGESVGLHVSRPRDRADDLEQRVGGDRAGKSGAGERDRERAETASHRVSTGVPGYRHFCVTPGGGWQRAAFRLGSAPPRSFNSVPRGGESADP